VVVVLQILLVWRHSDAATGGGDVVVEVIQLWRG
jgi:hypothetical protein